MTSPPAPEQVLDANELQHFIESCSREKRSPITHKTMDAVSYGWLQRLISEHLDSIDGGSTPWPPPPEVDQIALAGFFSRVMQRTREGPARAYAEELAGHFDEVSQGLAGWGREIVT
jgi:hypothetical protein